MDPLGTDRLDAVAELRFTVVEGGDVRSWAWAPATGVVTRGETTFVLGRPTTDVERAADQQFLRDTFWLAPQLHVGWAGTDATLVDDGPATFRGAPVRHVELRYAPTAGGYTPGDAHDLYLDPSGRIVGWSYRPAGGATPTVTVSFEAYVAVGPLALATVRRSADGTEPVQVRDLVVVPAGVGVSVGRDDVFLRVTDRGCALGPIEVGRRIPRTDGGDGISRTRALAESDRDPPSFEQGLSVRDGAAGAVDHAWSASSLALEDTRWLAEAGVLDCDFRAIDVPALRRVLGPASSLERSAVLTVLLEWTLAEVPLGTGWVMRRVRGAARACAETGRCEPLYVWVERRG